MLVLGAPFSHEMDPHPSAAVNEDNLGSTSSPDRSSSPAGRIRGLLVSPFKKISKSSSSASRRDITSSADPSAPHSPMSGLAPTSPRIDAHTPSPTTSVPPSPSHRSQVFAAVRPTPKGRFTRETPSCDLPQTWKDWNSAYRNGLLDFESIPRPPMNVPDASKANGTVIAPGPINEAQRQRTVAALDVVGPTSEYDDPSMHPLHPPLMRLVNEARARFGAQASSISIMDGGKQVFLAELGFGIKTMQRERTLCSHTIIKASTGQIDPLVVLSFADDWRFCDSDFGPYRKGFYSGCPIMLPSSLGDHHSPTNSYAAGIFCLMDPKARTSFSDDDRADLMDLAQRAGRVLLDYQKEREREQRNEVIKRLEGWRRTTPNRDREESPFGLLAIDETRALSSTSSTRDSPGAAPRPPTPPTLRHISSSEQIKLEMDEFAMSGRRPSLTPSLNSTAGSEHDLATTESSPVVCRRLAARFGSGGHMGQVGRSSLLRASTTLANTLPEATRSLFDIATRLLSESLDITFTCLVAVSLSNTLAPPSIELVSHHNMPISAPLFDPMPFLELFSSGDHSALLFVPTLVKSFDSPMLPGSPSLGNGGGSAAVAEFETGLMVRVGEATMVKSSTLGFVLAGFSDDERRVISSQDLHFFRQFAIDVKRAIENL